MSQTKVLVADDDTGILDAIKIILEDEGYAIQTTTDGDAVKVLDGDLPQLILLDIWMSGHDGRDLCRLLKNRTATKHVPIILISATTDVDKMAIECGADDYIVKPFDLDELINKVKKYIISQT